MIPGTPSDDAAATQPSLLMPHELAARWRMSTRTLDRWRAERYGPGWLVLGGRILYRVEDVEAFEARHRRGGGR